MMNMKHGLVLSVFYLDLDFPNPNAAPNAAPNPFFAYINIYLNKLKTKTNDKK